MKHLEGAFAGKNYWWLYIFMVLGAFFGAQLVGSIPLSLIVGLSPEGANQLSEGNGLNFKVLGINPHLGFALVLLPFVFSFFAFAALIKYLHERSLLSVINGLSGVRKGRILWGFTIWGSIVALFTFIDYYINMGDYQVNFDLGRLLLLALLAFIFLPFQTFFEELFVRGYLAQGVGVVTRNRIAVLIIPSAIFALLHGLNPEVTKHGFWLMMSQYFLIGFIYALASVLDDGIELAMGAHAANNIFLSIFVTTESSAFQTESLLRLMVDEMSAKDVIGIILGGAIFLGLCAFKYKWTLATLFKKIEAPSVFTNDDE